MPRSLTGSFCLFRAAGIDVYLHWTWFPVAALLLSRPLGHYTAAGWGLIEYLAIFGLVLLHEFGHALACRSVGGTADQIVLWPLGGIAFVRPPQRPGAFLWSLAAGPLVNLVLVPITVGLLVLAYYSGWPETLHNSFQLLQAIAVLNGILLVFNLLPIYPLDGGQILQALLWFLVGRAKSLRAACSIGLVGAVGLIGAAVLVFHSPMMGFIAFFAAWQAWLGLQRARVLIQIDRLPRHRDLACPSCGAAPLLGPFWTCGECGQAFDTFQHRAVCPNCFASFAETACPECCQRHRITAWIPAALPADGAVPNRTRTAHPSG